jgi:hypothetical protein
MPIQKPVLLLSRQHLIRDDGSFGFTKSDFPEKSVYSRPPPCGMCMKVHDTDRLGTSCDWPTVRWPRTVYPTLRPGLREVARGLGLPLAVAGVCASHAFSESICVWLKAPPNFRTSFGKVHPKNLQVTDLLGSHSLIRNRNIRHERTNHVHKKGHYHAHQAKISLTGDKTCI